MTQVSDTRADDLMRRSEIYRRLRTDPPMDQPAAAIAPEPAAPSQRRVPLPPQRNPGFLRRMVTLRPDGREIALVCVVLVVVLVL